MGFWQSKSWKRAKWSPPLNSPLEITAPTQLSEDSQIKLEVSPAAGEMTPTSLADTTSSETTFIYPVTKTSLPISPFSIFQSPSTSIKKTVKTFSLLDIVTKFAGSRLVFLTTLGLLLLWSVLGAVLGPTDIWQIIMQNGSSIQCYVSDTLLMRQQQNTCHDLLTAIAELNSRNRGIVRILKNLTPSQRSSLISDPPSKPTLTEPFPQKSNTFDRICDTVARHIGSLPALILYFLSITTWLSLGPYLHFSNRWQLYINTAVAVELTFTSIFLQNVRRRHADSLSLTLSSIKKRDCELEYRFRSLTGDISPNEAFRIDPPHTGIIERGIDKYAYVVGSGVGVAISAMVIAIWLGLGKVLHWDSNWWLIIGTYTGLVGFVDGFVLRNVYQRQSLLLHSELQKLEGKDAELYSLLDVSLEERAADDEEKKGWSVRVSEKMIVVCSLPIAVVGSLGVVVILVSIATALRWSETGQLIANSPTMIVEGFFLLVLFQAHNLADRRRRGQFGRVESGRTELAGLLIGNGVVDGGRDMDSSVESLKEANTKKSVSKV